MRSRDRGLHVKQLAEAERVSGRLVQACAPFALHLPKAGEDHWRTDAHIGSTSKSLRPPDHAAQGETRWRQVRCFVHIHRPFTTDLLEFAPRLAMRRLILKPRCVAIWLRVRERTPEKMLSCAGDQRFTIRPPAGGRSGWLRMRARRGGQRARRRSHENGCSRQPECDTSFAPRPRLRLGLVKHRALEL